MENLPIGCIFCYPSPICPEGFMPCDGRELSKQAYPELYAVIKNTWGETDTTFFLPDLQGQFVRGWDKDENIDPQRKFGSYQDDTFQGHCHELVVTGKMSEAEMGCEHHEIVYGTNTISSNKSISFSSILTQYEKELRDDVYNHFKRFRDKYTTAMRGCTDIEKSKSDISHRHELPKIEVKDAINSTFQRVRTSVETRPKNIALVYCIKVK